MKFTALLVVAGLLAGTGCGPAKPFPIDLGHEPCDHCHMTLADRRFAAELVTRTGRQFRFDDIGCLATFLADSGAQVSAGGRAWVSDFLHPDQWIPADSATYLRSSSVHTPMASGIVAVRTEVSLDSLAVALSGARLSWVQVLATARDSVH